MRVAPLLFLAALLAAGCASEPIPFTGTAPAYVDRGAIPGNGVALVLSGGSARGFAHAGVLAALERNGLKPDLIVGSSSGSIVGALYASGLDAAHLRAALERLDARVFSEPSELVVGLLPGTMGLMDTDGLREFIDQEAAKRDIADFPIRFAAVATNLSTGMPQAFNAGDVGQAVSASSAVPGLIAPVEINGRLYGDGQLSTPLPVETARAMGARTVIAVDVIYPPTDARLTGKLRVIFQAFVISTYRLKQLEARTADFVVAPDLGHTSGQYDFSDRERLIDAGEASTLAVIDRLRPLFARKP